MKKILITSIALALFFVSCKDQNKDAMEEETTIEADSTSVDTTTAVVEKPMDSVAMQKAWEAYMTPGDAHKRMADDVGTWNNEMKFWMDPNGEPTQATSKSEVKMIMDGRYQVAEDTGTMMGMPFEGRSTLAYDNATNEYISTWIDNMGTGLAVMRGTYDEASKSTTLKGTMVDPVTGKEKPIREVHTIVDENTRKMEFYDTAADGSEYKSMEIIMKRG